MPGAASVCQPEPHVLPVRRLRQRASFLRAARGLRLAMPAFVLQIVRRDDDPTVGIGFTASKKIGKAVTRNRARRRLREAARLVLPTHGIAGHDHVLVARAAVVAYPFASLIEDLTEALTMARTRLR